MDLATMAVEKTEARKAFLSYRDALKTRHDDELEQIMKGYRELSRGRQVVHLSETIKAGGFDARRYRRHSQAEWEIVTLPKLAVCRADERWVTVQVRRDRAVMFRGLKDEERNRQWGAGHSQRKRTVWAWDVNENPGPISEGEFDTMVPIVPPNLRPGHHLRNFHILFEADWKLRKQTLPAPRDPALLKHIGGDVYAVVAMWDLTDLERAVLAGRNVG